MKLVVVHHAHHAREGVYRMIYSQQEEHEVLVSRPNPGFNEDKAASDDNPEILTTVETVTVQAECQDIIWDANDSRWQGKSDKQIAEEQLRIVRESLQEREKKQAVPGHFNSLGTEGQELTGDS